MRLLPSSLIDCITSDGWFWMGFRLRHHTEVENETDSSSHNRIPSATTSQESTTLLPFADTPITHRAFPFRASGRIAITTTVISFALMSMATVIRQHRVSNTRAFLHAPSSSSTPIIAPLAPSSSSHTYTPDDIYCRGPILRTIQLNVPGDGKDFVDRPMKFDPDDVIAHFQQLPDHSVSTLQTFLDDNFYAPGSDVKPVIPPDFQSHPTVLMEAIANTTMREWAMELNHLWKLLGRQPDTKAFPRRHSFVPTAHFLVVPGGRFRESYYWDTYWIVHGLLACGMVDTAKGVVQNLLDCVETYGFVPNGGRIYFLNRSQPPLLSEMVRIVYDKLRATSTSTTAIEFLHQATATLDKEYAFWMRSGPNDHAVTVGKQQHVLNRYVSSADAPRPESYREDVETVTTAAKRGNASTAVYAELIAACESGWDFSSRWLRTPDDLSTAQTSQVLPVDLNAILHRMEKNMVEFHSVLEDPVHKVSMYQQAAQRRQEAIQEVLWDPATNMWRDVVLNGDERKFSAVLSASNYFPLWSASFDTTDTAVVSKIVDSLERSGLLGAAGIATTTTTGTRQQWDMPNAWPPLQDILIEGLLDCGETKLAHRLIRRWLQTNYEAWKQTGHMMEKYDAETGQAGGGGEYSLQYGFGWTNGIILKWLVQHWDQLEV